MKSSLKPFKIRVQPGKDPTRSNIKMSTTEVRVLKVTDKVYLYKGLKTCAILLKHLKNGRSLLFLNLDHLFEKYYKPHEWQQREIISIILFAVEIVVFFPVPSQTASYHALLVHFNKSKHDFGKKAHTMLPCGHCVVYNTLSSPHLYWGDHYLDPNFLFFKMLSCWEVSTAIFLKHGWILFVFLIWTIH